MIISWQGCKMFSKSWKHLRIPGARMVTGNKFHIENLQITVGIITCDLGATATWRVELSHPQPISLQNSHFSDV
jgi:hypothetical protein